MGAKQGDARSDVRAEGGLLISVKQKSQDLIYLVFSSSLIILTAPPLFNSPKTLLTVLELKFPSFAISLAVMGLFFPFKNLFSFHRLRNKWGFYISANLNNTEKI